MKTIKTNKPTIRDLAADDWKSVKEMPGERSAADTPTALAIWAARWRALPWGRKEKYPDQSDTDAKLFCASCSKDGAAFYIGKTAAPALPHQGVFSFQGLGR